MAKVFFADKDHLRHDKQVKKIKAKKGDKNPVTVQNKKPEQSWGDSLQGLFNFIKFIHVNRIYRMEKIFPISGLNMWGHLMGNLIGSSSKLRKRLNQSMLALYPDKPKKWIAKMALTNIKYLGMLILDVIFRLPQTCDVKKGDMYEHYTYENIDVLDKALAKGKGVIIPILHLGQHFHAPNSIFLGPKRYKMTTVASAKNVPMYQYNNRAYMGNIELFASTSFSKISKYLKRNLERGHCLVMYHDYSSKSQLRVPFIYQKYPYLIHTPQSYVRLHRLTGAEIIPLIGIPDKTFGKTRMKFLDNTSIMNTSKKYWNESDSEFHGQLSTKINQVMYPWVKIYAHYWEELSRFAGLRCADKLKFPPNCDLSLLLQLSFDKMREIITKSFEPGRKDALILEKIDNTFKKIKNNIQNPSTHFRDHKSFIDLSLMNTVSEIKKICCVLVKELTIFNEIDIIPHIQSLNQELTPFLPN